MKLSGSTPVRGRTDTRAAGFTLVETLVAGLVLVIGLIAIAQFFASATKRVTESDVRSLLMQVANSEIENIRALPYKDVGTTTGSPPGAIPETSTQTEDGIEVNITRHITYVTDASYSGPYPANYRRVTVIVSASQHPELDPVTVSTFVAGGAAGGTLDITVTRADGTPIPDAHIVVMNETLSPQVSLTSSAQKTNTLGKLLMPGLTPGTNYKVLAEKTGYNSAYKDGLTVVDGLPYCPVTLILEPVSTLIIRLIDPLAVPIPGKIMSISGPWDFNEEAITGADGTIRFDDLSYSPFPDGNYNVLLNPDQGYEPASTDISLPSGITLQVDLTATPLTTTTTPPPGSTTTTTGSSSTVTSSSTTTTTQPATTTTRLGSLQVTVVWSHWTWWGWWTEPQRNARVRLGGYPERQTNWRGQTTFNNIPTGTYTLTVTRDGFRDYNTTVTITGSNLITVELSRI